MIARVHHMLNNTVMAFNEKGKVLLQGKFEKVIEEIKQNSNGSTKFYVQGLSYPINPEFFYDKTYYNFFKSKGEK